MHFCQYVNVHNRMSNCPKASWSVNAGCNISGRSDDTMFSPSEDVLPECCLYMVRVGGCGCGVGFREASQIFFVIMVNYCL